MDGPAIERGAVLIGADGRIAAVGPEAAVPRPPEAVFEEFTDGLLLPGLINTHTHLELSGFSGGPEPDFAAWIGGVRARKERRGAAEFLAAARAGLEECWAAGVTTIADTGDSGAVAQVLCEAGGSGVVYHEVFGPHPAQADQSFAELVGRLGELCRWAGGRVRLGVSPHAPYTVSGRLYARVARWAAAEGLPLAVHLAESAAESALLAEGRGPFAEAWGRRGIPLPEPLGHSPVEWLERHGVLGPSTLCIHLVRAGPTDLARLAAMGCAVAHCPVSNAAHGHGTAPLAAMLAAGLRVGVGTDSVLSVGRLDLLAEARLARAIGELEAEEALALCTREAARALGLESGIGTLAPGKWGDCVVVRRPGGPGSPAEQALAAGPADVLLTVLGGGDVYRAPAAA